MNNNFIYNSENIHNDSSVKTASEKQSAAVGNYRLANFSSKKCDAVFNDVAFQRGVNFDEGYGWIGAEGCKVDNDSKLRNGRISTNKNIPQQMGSFPLPTAPYKGQSNLSLKKVDQESTLQRSANTRPLRHENPMSGASQYPTRFEKIPDKINPQKVNRVVLPFPQGGISTRTIKTNKKC